MDKLLHNYSSIPVLKREFYETTIEVRARIDRYILQFYVEVFIYTWPNLDADLAKKNADWDRFFEYPTVNIQYLT